MLKRIRRKFFRNMTSIVYGKALKRQVNLEWWNKKNNLGDVLSEIVFTWMLENKQIEKNKKISRTVHLFGIGSVIGMGNFDATIWGSGIHTFKTIKDIINQSKYRKYDIRAVRGPITAEILNVCGYKCPEIYGDPAVLMKNIYTPYNIEKKYKYSAILHIEHQDIDISDNIHYINMNTTDYKKVIDEIMASEVVISSSLHGIILSETYGVPAVFLKHGMGNELLKFYDWYYSTGRDSVKIANNMQEALQMVPMELPELEEMQERLIQSFPYDLWR